MSRTHTTVAAAAFACCLFAGAANAVPFFPDRETKRFEPTQIGSLPNNPHSPSRNDKVFGNFGRASYQADSQYRRYASADSSSGFGGSGGGGGAGGGSGGGASSYGSQNGSDRGRGGWNSYLDLIFYILAHLHDKHHHHHHHDNDGGSNGGGGSVGAPEVPTATPLPAPLLLLGSGLALVGLVVRRRKQAGAAVPA